MTDARYAALLPTELSMSKKEKRYNHQIAVLHRVNIAMFLLYSFLFCGFLAIAVVYQSNGLHTELTTDFRNYGAPFTVTVPRSLGFYPVLYVLVPVAAVAAVFHALLAFHDGFRERYEAQVLEEHRNDLKWIDYGINTSLIMWMVMQFCGVTNIFVMIVAAVVLSLATQYTNHMMELLNTPQQRQQRRGHSDWSAVWQGALLFTGQWAITWVYFFALVTSAHSPALARVPWYIYVVTIGQFVAGLVPGILLMLQYGLRTSRDSGYNTELAFAVISFLSRLVIVITMLVGVVHNS